jgi:hypothetical protein
VRGSVGLSCANNGIIRYRGMFCSCICCSCL